jgi:hypothetical protein
LGRTDLGSSRLEGDFEWFEGRIHFANEFRSMAIRYHEDTEEEGRIEAFNLESALAVSPRPFATIGVTGGAQDADAILWPGCVNEDIGFAQRLAFVVFDHTVEVGPVATG